MKANYTRCVLLPSGAQKILVFLKLKAARITDWVRHSCAYYSADKQFSAIDKLGNQLRRPRVWVMGSLPIMNKKVRLLVKRVEDLNKPNHFVEIFYLIKVFFQLVRGFDFYFNFLLHDLFTEMFRN